MNWDDLAPHVRRTGTLLAVTSFTATCLVCTSASARNESGAEMLFQAGRDAMARGDLEEACLKFKESNDVAPAPGTVLNLGNCEEQRGRIATAWEYFTVAMGMLEPGDPRYTVAEGRAQALEKRVPRLIIEFSPTAPSASRVYRSGTEVTTFGQPVRLDPGQHTVTVEAPGYERGEFNLTLLEGETETLVVSPGEQVVRPSPQTPVVIDQREDTLPWVLVGAGAVSLVGAGVLGGLSYARWNTVQDRCDLSAEPYVCDDKGLEAQSQGKTLGIIAAGLGLVAVTATVLYFTIPTQTHPTHSISAKVSAGKFGTYSGIRVSGEF